MDFLWSQWLQHWGVHGRSCLGCTLVRWCGHVISWSPWWFCLNELIMAICGRSVELSSESVSFSFQNIVQQMLDDLGDVTMHDSRHQTQNPVIESFQSPYVWSDITASDDMRPALCCLYKYSYSQCNCILDTIMSHVAWMSMYNEWVFSWLHSNRDG